MISFQLLRRFIDSSSGFSVVVRQYIGRVSDGEIRLIAAIEPTEEGDLFHVSVSVGKPGVIGSFRKPHDYEMACVKIQFNTFVLEELPAVDHPHVRHLWEKANA